MRVSVSCLGSRERYGMPVALHKLEMLDVLYTDLYVPHFVSQLGNFSWLNNGFAALLGRNHADLPFRLVRTQLLLGLEFRFKVRRARQLNEQLSLSIKFGSRFAGQIVKDILRVDSDFLVAFSGAALETFAMMKNSKSQAFRILDQIDPGLNDYLLIENECKRYPQWGEGNEQINRNYFDRVKSEIYLADHLIVNSHYSATMVQGWVGNKPISVLPIPSSFERKLKSNFNNQGRLKVLFLGTLSLRKGIHYALEAVERMRQSGFDIELTLAGGCRIDANMLHNYKCIDYLGSVPSRMVQALLDSHDILLFPTLSEGFGIVQVEAISRSVPVIATKNCGAVVEHDVSGLVIDAMCTDSIVEGLTRYYNDRALLAQHSRNAFTRSESFTVENYAKALAVVLGDLKK